MRSFIMVTLLASTASADPCGMVPPLWTGPGPAISRVGEQMTYAFFKDGVETFVIRPGFSGNVDNFGMLIPFPSVPAVRKVPDEIFQHIAASIDPPEVIIDLRPPPPYEEYEMMADSAPSMAAEDDGGLRYDEVRVIKQEAVGMYEVTVLQAGSPAALKRWMDQHGYVYPKGMDAPVLDYVKARWAFVAIKTKVGSKPQITPRPGMRRADATLPKGSSFDGSVQGMGFRFRVKKPVVPMRLSAFNDGQLRNIVYFLAEDPARIDDLDLALVKRQTRGAEIYENLSLLPVRIYGGGIGDVSTEQWDNVLPQRNPGPHNGHARELYASDLLAVKRGKLALPFEEKEKTLLRISEALFLRGTQVDHMHHQALEDEKKQTLTRVLKGVRKMTLTVIDGDFPRKYIGDHNLTFSKFVMKKKKNTAVKYNARNKGPGYDPGGVLVRGRYHPGDDQPWWRFW